MALFLKNITLEEAQSIIQDKCRNIIIESENVDTIQAVGRILAEPVFAKNSSPHFIASAMDGIATKFSYTLEADLNRPILLDKTQYMVVDTGDPIEDEHDCVIMVEDITETENGILIRKPAVPYQNIRPIGEDMAMGAMILPSNHKIRPIEISSLLAGGCNKVPVYGKIIVGVIPTGDELVDAGKEPERGELIDFNSWTFCAIVEEWGGEAVRYDIVKDNPEDLKKAILKAVDECHIVIVNAGSAKGRGDFAEDMLNDIGEIYFHGISIKPGRPASFAAVRGIPVFGVPGYPVSAYFVMDNVVKTGFYSMLHKPLPKRPIVDAIISRKVVSSLKNYEFIRVKLGRVDDKLIASPMGRGAGVTMSLTNADGVFALDRDSEGVEAGTAVKVELLRDISGIDKSLVSIGSHDVIMDIIADLMNKRGYDLSSSHVGSMGGIMALKRGETHMAPIHLLDEDGEYNVAYVKKYLTDHIIVKLVKRIQGFMVKKGNPLNVRNFNDLTRIRYVNRQKGAGTRLLLDYNLNKLGISPQNITGYDREELTHLTVAAQIAGGSADCGMGVLSAAIYMGLDFIEICSEDYDIAVPRKMLEDERFKTFMEVIASRVFMDKVESIGGYDMSNTGEIIRIGG